MAEPRYQPPPRYQPVPRPPAPLGPLRPRVERAPKPPAARALPAPPNQEKPWWEDAPIVQGDPQQSPAVSEKQEQWWLDAPIVQEVETEKEPSFYDYVVSPTIDAVGGALTATRDYLVGKEDPKFGKLPSIDEPEIAKDAGLNFFALERAKMAAPMDNAYLDIIRKQLGNRFLGVQKDANGADVITYRGADGRQKQAYLNKPGLDYRDIDRGLTSALPYAAAGNVVAKLGGPLWAQGAAQIVGQGATSVAQDYAAGRMGSEQGTDLWKAGFAAAGGGIGTFAVPALKAIMGGKKPVDPKWVKPNGDLTDYAKRKLTTDYPGIDTFALGKRGNRSFGRKANAAYDPTEAYFQTQTEAFGIPTSRYQRSRLQHEGLIEKDLRAATFGTIPQKRMLDFDKHQKQRISEVVRGSEHTPAPSLGPNATPDPATHGFAATLAPHRVFMDQNRELLGDGIQRGFHEAKNQLKGRENLAWAQTQNIAPRAGGASNIGQFVAKSLGDHIVDEKVTPTAAQMAKDIINFRDGQAINTDIAELTGQQAVRYVDQMRRRLLGFMRGAQPGEDKAAAAKIYGGFKEWIEHAAENHMLTGRATDAMNLRNAISTTKQVQGLLKPLKNGKRTSVTRILEKVENSESGAEVLTALLGSSSSKGEFHRGGVRALQQYKRIVLQNAGPLGVRAWNDVRLAHWIKNVTGKDGLTLSPGYIRNNIRAMLHNQAAVAKTLYSPREIAEMRKLAAALDVVAAPDPNPSGSGTAVRNIFSKLTQTTLESQSQREKFVKGNILIGNMWRLLAKSIPFFEKMAGGGTVHKATSQQIARRRIPHPGAGMGGAIGAQLSNHGGS